MPALRLPARTPVAAAALAAMAVALEPPVRPGAPDLRRGDLLDLVELAPAALSWRPGGDFSRAGAPAAAPVVTERIPGLAVMRRQVSATDYGSCVAAGACAPPDRPSDADQPVVGVSFRDATAYAQWLSRRTGQRLRLPSDAEWAHAAGSRFAGDALPEPAASNPGQRALAAYEAQTSRDEPDRAPKPSGSFGINEKGLYDLAGNVWEWTQTCFSRSMLDSRNGVVAVMVSCGVRVVEGRHRAYVADFIRDPRAGGCSVGTPLANLGFRLVRGP